MEHPAHSERGGSIPPSMTSKSALSTRASERAARHGTLARKSKRPKQRAWELHLTRRRAQRDIRNKAQVAQLVGVEHRVHALDPAVDDVDLDHVDQPAVRG